MAMFAEIHRDPKKRNRPYVFDDFHPYARKREKPVVRKVTMDRALKILGL